jgi:hypothetical protein
MVNLITLSELGSVMDKETLILLQEKFKTDAEIGRQINMTRQSVFQWRKKHDIPSVKFSKHRRNNSIIQLHQAKININKIASIHHMSRSQVYSVLHRYGCIEREKNEGTGRQDPGQIT